MRLLCQAPRPRLPTTTRSTLLTLAYCTMASPMSDEAEGFMEASQQQEKGTRSDIEYMGELNTCNKDGSS